MRSEKWEDIKKPGLSVSDDKPGRENYCKRFTIPYHIACRRANDVGDDGKLQTNYSCVKGMASQTYYPSSTQKKVIDKKLASSIDILWIENEHSFKEIFLLHDKIHRQK